MSKEEIIQTINEVNSCEIMIQKLEGTLKDIKVGDAISARLDVNYGGKFMKKSYTIYLSEKELIELIKNRAVIRKTELVSLKEKYNSIKKEPLP